MGTVFTKFVQLFHQDILSIHNDIGDAIEEAVGGLNDSEKSELKEELERIQADKTIKFVSLWNGTRSAFGLQNEKGARIFLQELIERL